MSPRFYYDIEQGSEAWLRLRLASITASGITPIFKQDNDVELYARGGISYIRNKVDEAIFQEIKFFETDATRHGHTHEPTAAEEYEKLYNVKTSIVAFVELEPGIACSPDRLVGDDGLLEIKCPYNQKTHAGYLKKGEAPKDYLYQMLHQLFVTGRLWVDFFSFDPRVEGNGRFFCKRYTVESICQLLGERIDLYELRVRQTAWMISTVSGMIKEIMDKRGIEFSLKESEEDEFDDVDEVWD